MQFVHFDDDTAYLLREVCREAFDFLVIEAHPSTASPHEAATRAYIERCVRLAAEAGERSPRRLCDRAVAEIRKLPSERVATAAATLVTTQGAGFTPASAERRTRLQRR